MARVPEAMSDVRGHPVLDRAFHAQLEHTRSAVALLDTAGTILHASEANRELLGREPASLVGTNGFDLVHPDDVPFCRARLATVVGTPAGQADVCARVRHADGSWHDIEAVFTNLIHDERVGAIVCNYRDRRFVDDLAHDFNNILTSILGHLELIRRACGRDPRVGLSVAEIEHGARRISLLTQQLSPGRPVLPDAPDDAAPAPVAPRVLVVDDEITVRRVVARALRTAGHDVVEADSIHAALRLLRDAGVDLVVTDLRLPDGDGLALARTAEQVAPTTRFLLMTGFAEIDEVDGQPRLLRKPFTPAELLAAVTGALAS